ncbi:MAG: glucose-6-phosphate dehydrogenase assembly protein OpcA [bacterium]
MSAYALGDLLQGQKLQVEIDSVASALRELGEQVAPPIAQRCELNLLVLLSDVHLAEQVLEAVTEFSLLHPNRALIVFTDPEAEQREESAYVSLQCLPNSQTICCEQVTLRVRGAEAVHALPQRVWPLLVAVQPILFWSVQGLPESSSLIERLQKTSARLIYDTARAPELGITLARAHELVEDWKAGVLDDFSWLRLAPWREVVQSHLSTPAFQEFAPFIDKITVRLGGGVLDENRMAQPALFLSWLAALGNWQLSESLAYDRNMLYVTWDRKGGEIKCEIQLDEEAEPELSSVHIHAQQEDREMVLKVVRSSAPEEIMLKCSLVKSTSGGQSTLSEIQKPYSPQTPAQLLAQSYERSDRDDLYIKTLHLATKMV